MGRYLIRRFAELILTVFLIATATFFLLEAVPGDPLTQRADHLPEQTRTALYQRYGLDKPVMERYLITMKKMCKGDFGESFVYAGQTVTGLLKTKLPVSARLGIQQMLLGVTLGLLLGIVAAMKRGTFIDYLIVGLSVLLISVPHLIFGLLLQKVFAGNLRWFPTIGWPRGKGFVVWRMEVYCSSNSDRMFLLYCNLHETLKDLYAGCCKSGLRTDSRVKGLKQICNHS